MLSSSALLLRRTTLCSVVALCLTSLSGCSTGGGKGATGGTTDPGGPTNFTNASGNWMLTGTSSTDRSGVNMSGTIAEQSGSGASRFATASFRVAAPCYLNAAIVPMDGQITATRLQLSSFNVQSQFLQVDATKNTDATQLTGSYSVTGGCAAGQTGSITGQRYSAFTGTYAGSVASVPSHQFVLTVAQESEGTGEGKFLLSGSAHISGIPCFDSAQVAAAGSYISGKNVALQLNTNDPSQAQMLMQGFIDPRAETLTVSAAQVMAGNCSGDLGQFTFGRQ